MDDEGEGRARMPSNGQGGEGSAGVPRFGQGGEGTERVAYVLTSRVRVVSYRRGG